MATGPVYMNATPHHSKVRVTLTLSSPLFIAGQDVTGKMEVECRADMDVGIGLVMIELFAIQELNSRDHSARSTFLHTRRLFQGPGLPPSNAVEPYPRPGEPPFSQGYFPARRGITSFFFRFPLPLSSPSSISFASGLAKLRYEVRASVGVAHRGEKRVVTDVAEADIVQCEDMDGAAAEHVVVGENGKIYIQGRIAGGRIVSGRQACLELHVKNHSLKKTTGLTLILTRILHLHNATATSQAPLQLSDTLYSQTFRGTEYTVQAGTEGIANLVFDVPKAARVVKGGIREGADDREGGRRQTESLFEIQCILSVKIGMGIGHKDVVFEMQVQLSHPATLSESLPASEPYASPASDPYAAAPNAFYGHHSPRAMSPVFPPPNAYFTHSPDPNSGTSPPSQPYASPPIPSSSASPQQYYQPLSPIPPYALPASPHQHLWSPPTAVSPLPYYFPNSQHAYFFPPPPVTLVPFAYPARPSSAGAGHVHNTSPASGLPGVEAIGPVYSSLDNPQQQTDVPFVSHSHPKPEAELILDTGGEEGKGARASRISQHLRMSTRARSMSPTSHRFPSASSALPPTPVALHATSPRQRDGPPVLSPRPLLSPRNSFSADAVVHNTVPETHGTARSGRVDLLERLVDIAPGEEGKSVEDVLKGLEKVEKQKQVDKTLPKPPVLSGKAEVFKKLSNVPKASEVFEFQAPKRRFDNAEEDKPMKSVLRPSPMPRRINTHEMYREQASGSHSESSKGVRALGLSPEQHSSGLDALEKRLLQEVGTRKPGSPDRPTIFELGIVAPVLAVPRSNGTSTHQETEESEISSLALASNGLTDGYRQGDLGPAEFTPVSLPPVSPMYNWENVKGERPVPGFAADEDRLSVTRKGRLSEEKSKEQEAIKLRKAAKGRVADWLGDMAIRPGAGQEGDSRPLRRTSGTVEMSPNRESPANKISVPIPSSPVSPRTPFLKPVDSPMKAKKPKVINVPSMVSGSPNPSAEFKFLLNPHKPDVSAGKPAVDTPIASADSAVKASSPISRPIRKPVPPLDDDKILKRTQSASPPAIQADKVAGCSAKLLLPQGIPETKYDVRSARGGKGGITTSVAALWTSLAEEGKEDNSPKRSTKPVTRKKVPRLAFSDVGKPKPIPAFTGAPPNPTSDDSPTPLSSIPEPPHPRNLVKSTSVPATVVPSHARPYLSSTASLARPAATPLSRTKPPFLSSTLSEPVPEDMSNTGPVVSRDMAFGQARLKDLIKKYQQSAS